VKNPLGNKLYYSISEVAEITDLQPYTLRAWEKEFPCLRPKRGRGKNRAYRERDIGIVLLIRHLLYEQRYTSQGVKQRLNTDPDLVREAGSDLATMLDPVARAQRVGLDPRIRGDDPPDEDRTDPATPAPATAGGPVVAATTDEISAALRAARQELRDLLELL
jgi:DNA-binding transcriptional MerR regulator